MSSSLSPIAPRRILQHAQSHCSRVLRPTSYSARGSLFSSLTLGATAGVVLATSGVIAHTWPGWATVLAIKRLRLRWIILIENDLYPLVKVSFPEISVFKLSDVQWASLPQVDIVAFNGDHSSFGSPLPFGSLVMWDSAVSLDGKLWKSWMISRHLVSHSECGGVSDGTTTVVLALHKTSSP